MVMLGYDCKEAKTAVIFINGLSMRSLSNRLPCQYVIGWGSCQLENKMIICLLQLQCLLKQHSPMRFRSCLDSILKSVRGCFLLV